MALHITADTKSARRTFEYRDKPTTYNHFVSTEKTYTRNNSTIVECVSQVFMKAYDAARSKDTPVILVIKDIHRGDVPKIFGEFYGLLDRVDGKSEHPTGVNDQPQITTWHSLPNNFYIWGTMTTGEEAAFAMDYAFQRKWYWEYVPLNVENCMNFDIEIGHNFYRWYDILKAINDVIFRYTHSEEQLLGESFIDDDKNYYIWKSSDFKNFVMRHLWYTFCKDNYGTDKNFFRYQDPQFKGATVEFTFQQLFTSKGDDILEKFLDFIGCLART